MEKQKKNKHAATHIMTKGTPNFTYLVIMGIGFAGGLLGLAVVAGLLESVWPTFSHYIIVGVITAFFLGILAIFAYVIFENIVHGYKINARKEREKEVPAENYFFDLLEIAQENKWTHNSRDRNNLMITGRIKGQDFQIKASRKRVSRFGGKHRIRKNGYEETILIRFGIPRERTGFYFTQGDLPGWLGEKVVELPRGKIKGVTIINSSNEPISEEVLAMMEVNRSSIEALFKSEACLSELWFETKQGLDETEGVSAPWESTMTAILLDDQDKRGETQILGILELLSELVKNEKI
jgi:hypothetical protein